MIQQLIDFRSDKLFYYSEANFIKKIKQEIHLELIHEKIQQYLQSTKENYFFIEICVSNKTHYFLLEFLAWDTNF